MLRMSQVGRTRLLSTESGFALPAAIIVLLLITLLTGAAVTVAVQTSKSTTRDNNVKAEIEAAEAGLQVASYRLTQLKPEETQCINENKAVSSGCNDNRESLGNGATFQYWTTLPLKAGEKCAGRSVEAIANTIQRCITSEGRVNGVEPAARLQGRVTSLPGEPLFSFKGIAGLSEVKISGSVKVPAVVVSNEKIIGEGSAAFERGYELCPPKGSFTPKAGAERNASGVTVGGFKEDPPLEKERSAGECPIKAPLPPGHATAEKNEDARIGKTDKLEGTTAWSEKTHEITLESNGKLTLEGSQYYFCNFEASRNSRLIIGAFAKVEIFIDSASTCGNGKGKFEGKGEFIVENLAKSSAALLIEMAGVGPFKLKNGSQLEGSIYAPEAEVTINGGTTFKGGIVGNKVHLENGAGIFEWGEESSLLNNGVPTAYSRKAWEQCTPGSGPTEGC